jgi:hypothetical protein
MDDSEEESAGRQLRLNRGRRLAGAAMPFVQFKGTQKEKEKS